MFRRQFESATRRPGMDPAMFATELEILAVRGFGDMSKRARDWMIRDRFIAAQQSCGLCRHIDGVPPDTPIQDIVDRCRVWESHSEQESGSDAGRGPSGKVRWLSGTRTSPSGFTGTNGVSGSGLASSGANDVETQWKVGNGDSQLAEG